MFTILIIIFIILLFYYFLLKPQLYWKSKHVKQGLPIPLLGDSVKIAFKRESMTEMIKRIYERDPESRYTGMYQAITPVLVIRDPELIKQITVKDFDHFVDHMNMVSDENEPIWSKNLFSLKGDKWRAMRATLSPTFTASKMRLMFELMEKSAQQYVEFYLEKDEDTHELELKESFRRFANDVIANCAFGVTVDSLKNPKNDFFLKGVEVTNLSGFWRNLKFMIFVMMPKLAAFLRLSIISSSTTSFFKALVKDTVKLREENNIIRPDMINLLMEARKGKLRYDESVEEEAGFATVQESDVGKSEHLQTVAMTEDAMTAQVIIFFFAGFESISVMMSLTCYELAVNPDIQQKLRDEIDATFAKNGDKLTYDILNRMKYMDMVIAESLRKHPPGVGTDRMCTKAYTIQPVNSDETAVELEPGQLISIPVYGIHHDEKYYENPSKFMPERFSDENKGNIRPYTYIPFGSGPRNCIGSRFALMEVKTLLFHVLRKFEMIVIGKTTIPFKYDRHQFNPAIEGGCWVGFKRRQNKD